MRGELNRLDVKLTQVHIDTGNPLSVLSCPVALATQEAAQALETELKARVIVDPVNITVSVDSVPLTVRQIFDTPIAVTRWMKDFDNGKKVEPFEFTLERS